MNAFGIKAGFILTAYANGLFSATFNVLLYFFSIVQVVANHCIYVAELQGWILLSDFFSSGALIEGFHKGVQRYASAGYANNTIQIGFYWDLEDCTHFRSLPSVAHSVVHSSGHKKRIFTFVEFWFLDALEQLGRTTRASRL